MNLTKFYKVPLVALLTFTAVYPASAVLAEEGVGAPQAPATTETTVSETEAPAPTPVEPAPAEEAPQTPETAPTESETVDAPKAPLTEPALTPASGTPTQTNTEIPVTGEIDVMETSFATDFNSLFFLGMVGNENNYAMAKMGTEVVNSPHIYMSARENYSLMISGTDMTTTQGELFSVSRIGVSVDNGELVRLSNAPTLIDSGAGTLSIRKPIAFKLDLSMRNNSYPDNDRLQALTEDTEFTNTITFSYTGL